jgi:hypothetical protein
VPVEKGTMTVYGWAKLTDHAGRAVYSPKNVAYLRPD